MMPQPIYDAITSIEGYEQAYKIYLSPKGRIFNQEKAKQLSEKNHIILLCGHYEGVDQRIIDLLIDEEISIGDFVLTGGELPSMILVDAISRLQSGVLGSDESSEIETFKDNLLEYPQYTKPREFKGLTVPDILVSGDHKKIDEWRRNESIKITSERRPDLYAKFVEQENIINAEKMKNKKKRK